VRQIATYRRAALFLDSAYLARVALGVCGYGAGGVSGGRVEDSAVRLVPGGARLLVAGTRATKNGQRHLVDRRDRRDLSRFEIGWRIVERYLINDRPFSIRLRPLVSPKRSRSQFRNAKSRSTW
jgi:hypothetical protein